MVREFKDREELLEKEIEQKQSQIEKLQQINRTQD
jgi:hypothetical protein